MKPAQREAARKLLELEKRAQQGHLAPDDRRIWVRLVNELLGGLRGPHRRFNIRFEARARCVVRSGNGSFPCDVVQVSLVGLTLAGEQFRYLPAGTPITIDTFDDGKQRLELGIPCSVVRVDSGVSPPVAGVQFLVDGSNEAWRRYFGQAYYPIYFGFIQGLAAPGGAQAKPAPKKKKAALKKKVAPKKKAAPKKKKAAPKKKKAAPKKKKSAPKKKKAPKKK